jgi:hypothetical protein
MTVADTSMEAYRIVTALGITAKQQLRLVRHLAAAEEPLTRNELEDRTGIRLSSVCAAVNALLHKREVPALVELPPRKCRVTGYKCHPVWVAALNNYPEPVDERDAQSQAPDHQLSFWGGDKVEPPRRLD